MMHAGTDEVTDESRANKMELAHIRYVTNVHT